MLPPVIIACAGAGERWGNYLGVTKWMLPFDGAPLVHRTVGQLLSVGFDDIRVFTADQAMVPVFARWSFPPIPTEDAMIPHTPFAHTLPTWPEAFLLLMGDVYYTEAAMTRIRQAACSDAFQYIARGIWRGIHGPETFGMFVPAHERANVAQALRYVAENLPPQNHSAQWMTYRRLNGFPLTQHVVNFSRGFVHIDDATEDFDTPECFDIWRRDWSVAVQS